MLRRLTASLLIIALVAANFSRLFIYAGFEINKGYIAAHLCVNINRPWLQCGGKCYYNKKIKQAQEKEKTGDRPSQKNLFQEGLFTQKSVIKFYTRVLRVMHVPNHSAALPFVQIPIFQPPQLG
jgi:hypothetical protein